MKKSSFQLISIILVIMLFATGCGMIKKEKEGPVKVGLLLMSSPDDKDSEGYYGYNALKALENKYGVEIAYNDNVRNESNAGFLLNSYGKKGYDLVIGIGKMFQKPMLDVAPSYLDTRFVCIGGDISEDNVLSYMMPVVDIGYIAGILSAGLNENKANGIAYVQNETGANYYEGFLKGVRDVNSQTPVIELLLKSDDTFTGFVDKFKGYNIGVAGLMFYSASFEKVLGDRSYLFTTFGGGLDGVEVPRIILNYNLLLEMAYLDFLKGDVGGENIDLSLGDDILSVYGLDLLDAAYRARIEALLPKGN
jgi:basic membrane lipoprotein Med (substrate-binding protein (PBP1-ABC) superfamily)